MRITGNPNIQNVLKSYSKNVSKTEDVQKASYPNDKVEISSEAKDFQLAMKALKDISDVREEKVEAVKSQIKSGSYKPSAEDVASKILGALEGIDE